MSAVIQLVEPIAARARHRRQRTSVWSPCLLVASLTVAVGVSGMRGADYPGHYVRALVWERSGAWAWSNLWYGGHSTVPYSVLAPALMALIGPFALVAIGSIASTYLFSATTFERVPSSSTALANHVFALAMAVNVVVGRAPFALGLAFALLAVRAWTRDRIGTALVAAIAAPLISPVAGGFLAIASGSVAVARVRRLRASPHDRRVSLHAVAITSAALAPMALVTVLFGDSGWFPFRGGHFVATVATLMLAAAVPRRTVRVAAAAAIAMAAVVFLVRNPLGGNFVRLPQIVAVPIAVSAFPTVSKRWRAPFAVALTAGIAWSVHPGVVAAVEWWGDESIDAAYHEPLIEEVRRRNLDGAPIGRLEIPFTENHWESLFVASEVPFARGWERQIDLERNSTLYDVGLTGEEYRAWLLDNGVRWIALPDVALDHAGRPEQVAIDGADLDRNGWLRLIWSNDDWRLYEIDDYAPIVEAPAELIEQGTDSIVVRTPRPATVTIRYRYTQHLTISGSACVADDGSGWIVAELPAPGEYRLTVDPAATWLGTAADQCA